MRLPAYLERVAGAKGVGRRHVLDTTRKHDLACVVHLHSLHSDGTGTVPEIAGAARRAKADVVLLTDHDSLEAKRRGEEGWYGDVLVLVGTEVSPPRRNHYLAFGLDEEIDHSRLDAAGIWRAVRPAGGFGFAAHPFSRGSARFRRTEGRSCARAQTRFLCPDCQAVVNAGAARFAFCSACGAPLTTENVLPIQLIRTGRDRLEETVPEPAGSSG